MEDYDNISCIVDKKLWSALEYLDVSCSQVGGERFFAVTRSGLGGRDSHGCLFADIRRGEAETGHYGATNGGLSALTGTTARHYERRGVTAVVVGPRAFWKRQ
jgi:NAD(P)-dependent dehydrogenase (short-subunit alcohol dehydrogenase family)